jgi:predicted DsbA family dithiol-disulfide isomerase
VLEAATRRFGADLDVRWHAFELRPDPAPLPDPDSDYISEHWENRVLPMAAERGLMMRTPRRQIRSRRALQAALFAQEHGHFADFDRRVFLARFEDDLDISSVEVLTGIAGEVGLNPDALAYALKSHAYLDRVIEDGALAQAIGINGVPAALVGQPAADIAEFVADAEPVIGAVPEEWMLGAIERAISGDRAHARLRRRFRPDIKIE